MKVTLWEGQDVCQMLVRFAPVSAGIGNRRCSSLTVFVVARRFQVVQPIMPSGSTDRVHQVKASALRALLFLQKPIETDVLLDTLRGLGLAVTRVVKGQGFGTSEVMLHRAP